MFSISVKLVHTLQATQFTKFEKFQVGLNQVDRFYVGKTGKLVEFRIQANDSLEKNAVNTSHQFEDFRFISVNTNKAVYIQRKGGWKSTAELVPTYRHSFENISNPQYISTNGYIIGYISDDDVVFHDSPRNKFHAISGINFNLKHLKLNFWDSVAIGMTSNHILVADDTTKTFEIFNGTGKMLSYLEAL